MHRIPAIRPAIRDGANRPEAVPRQRRIVGEPRTYSLLTILRARVVHEGESPYGLARIYLPRDLAPAGVLDDEASWRETATRFAVLSSPPAAVRETVCARPPTPDEASTLRIGSAVAVLAITRVATDCTGRVIEAALLAFPGDRVDAVFTTHHVTDERQKQG